MIILLLMLFPSVVFAQESIGECRSYNKYYDNVIFSLNQFDDLKEAVTFSKKYSGQIVTDQNKGEVYVIWNNNIPAPSTEYSCSPLFSE